MEWNGMVKEPSLTIMPTMMWEKGRNDSLENHKTNTLRIIEEELN